MSRFERLMRSVAMTNLARVAAIAAASLASLLVPAAFGADVSTLAIATPSPSVEADMHKAVSEQIRSRPIAWRENESRKAWTRSLIPLFASQSLDAASSYGLRELNPLLADPNGGFGMRATTVKFAAVGMFAGGEYVLVRKYPRSAKFFSKLNWTAAAVTAGFAIHNFALR